MWGASFYTSRLDDRQAVYVGPGESGARADGIADDTNAIQSAIDRVQQEHGDGIVFLAEGRYRISRTIYVWPMIRVIGFGAKRPVLLLPDHTAGFGDKNNENYMVFFAGARPKEPFAGRPPDANPGTFYSALSNVDIEIGQANAGAVGVRGTYAQHCFLAHMDFHVGSGLAAVHDSGNVMEDVRFFGGEYGVWSRTPSPGWQLTLVDSYFEGQREAAIRDEEAGLTLIRPQFQNVPTAVTIDAGNPDDLWMKDARFEHISGPALVISLENNARTEINLESAVCRDVPVFASYRESGRRVNGPAPIYLVKTFTHGLSFDRLDGTGQIRDVFDEAGVAAMPDAVHSDLSAPPPTNTWVNIRTLGAKGDGVNDDTSIFRQAIAQHRAIYIPSGYYVVSDSLTLRPDTVLIGLHPLATQIDLLDGTPAFQGVGSPKALLEAPKGGSNIVTGIGLYTNGINPRAVAAKWMAGRESLMNDVRFLGGHGTVDFHGHRVNPYNNTHTADPDIHRRWNSQYPSLWVTDGGGGTFFDIWTPSTFAQAGMLISDTATEGRVYQLSSEHHVRNEVQIRRAANWSIYALQTEEERGESPFALPLDIESSNNITIANFHNYRVISSYQPFPYAIEIWDSNHIHFRNVHGYSNSKVAFDSSIRDETNGLELRDREFALADVDDSKLVTHAADASSPVKKLADGFFNISGGAVAPGGDFFFVDEHRQTIYRWSVASQRLSIVRENPLDPVNLAFDRAGNLLVVSYSGKGTVYAFNPTTPGAEVTLLQPQPAAPRPNMTPVLPVGDWRYHAMPRTVDYLSPDNTTFLSAREDFASGATSWGIKSADLLRSFGLATAEPGKPFYFSSEAEVMTYSGAVNDSGDLTQIKPFANRGGESVAVGPDGNVYMAAGQIYVYSPAGKMLKRINVPKRPIQLVFGGADGRTLFITARDSLYSLRVGE